MGLLQRLIEAAGISTITLSNVPDLAAAMSIPRLAAIESPIGRTVGQPGDRQGQLAVLRATLQALVEIEAPGGVRHLPFDWPEHPKQARARSRELAPPPIASHLVRHPWNLPRLMRRDPPPGD